MARVTVKEKLRDAREVLHRTLADCLDSEPGASPDDVQSRLREALRLATAIEAVDDFQQDFGHHQSILDLHEIIETRYRTDLKREEMGYRRGGVVERRFSENFLIRYQSHYDRMNGIARSLKNRYSPMAYHKPIRELLTTVEIVNICFDAALTLEEAYERHIRSKEVAHG